MTPVAAETEKGRMVVARFLDGRLLKGTIHDFAPNKDVFHLYEGGDERSEAVPIRADRLKALFFVKTFEGDAEHRHDNSFAEAAGQGRKMMVRFLDGEVIAGFTMGYSRQKQGFFLIPADSAGNNARVFVLNRAVAAIRWV